MLLYFCSVENISSHMDDYGHLILNLISIYPKISSKVLQNFSKNLLNVYFDFHKLHSKFPTHFLKRCLIDFFLTFS